jgi:exosome complex component RRP42
MKDHVKKSLDQNVRVDGRDIHEHRELDVEAGVISTAEGSARVTAGDAEILAGVKIESREPYPDSPDEGSIMVNVELLSMSDREFESGRPGIESIEPSRVIDRGLRESGAIDLEELCIEEGETVLGISIDIVPLNYDGNIYGLAALAALAALKDLDMPAVDDNGNIDWDEDGDMDFELDLEPLPVTIYKVDDLLLVDPTKDEEDIADARLTVTTLDDERVCSLQKGGDAPISDDEFNDMIDLAFETTEALRDDIDAI